MILVGQKLIHLYRSTSRQPMFSNTAWQRHGCYSLGSQDIEDFPIDRASTGCTDDWNSLDHFDPTADSRLVWKRINQIRQSYSVLVDGFSLSESGNWTTERAPTSRGVVRSQGLWSVYRDWLINGTRSEDSGVWLIYSNKVMNESSFGSAPLLIDRCFL